MIDMYSRHKRVSVWLRVCEEIQIKINVYVKTRFIKERTIRKTLYDKAFSAFRKTSVEILFR